MNALSTEQRERHQELGRQLRAALVAVHELPDGYEFEFPCNAATHEMLTELTPLEHTCCPFFAIATRQEDAGLFWQLTGGEGVKQFIRMEFAEWFRAVR